MLRIRTPANKLPSCWAGPGDRSSTWDNGRLQALFQRSAPVHGSSVQRHGVVRSPGEPHPERSTEQEVPHDGPGRHADSQRGRSVEHAVADVGGERGAPHGDDLQVLWRYSVEEAFAGTQGDRCDVDAEFVDEAGG
jgi:hypothetical protein